MTRGRPHACRSADGTELRGHLWEAENPRAVVFIRTPYRAAALASTAQAFVDRGCHCVVHDVRGRYDSDGVWAPYRHEAADGHALLRTLAKEHPGLPLIGYGASYSAHTALEAARAAVSADETAPAALIILVPALGPAETAWDPAGRPHTWDRIGWWHQHGRSRRSLPALSDRELADRTAEVAALGPADAARGWGWAEAHVTAWTQLWAAERIDVAQHYRELTMPLLVVGGDDDVFATDAAGLAAAWPGPSHHVTGPWGHDLIAGIPDAALRGRIQATGGLGHIIDPWLHTHGLPGRRSPWTSVLEGHTRSRYDTALRQWSHERTTP